MASMKILNALQNLSPDMQLLSSGIIFLAISRRFRVSPNEMIQGIDNMMRNAKRYDAATFSAVTQYFNGEI